jgi:malic enzyme
MKISRSKKSRDNVPLNVSFTSRYKQEYLMFNDDIQGTAATVLAGLYGAMKVQGLGPEAIKDQVDST